jgi:hypothetical protein
VRALPRVHRLDPALPGPRRERVDRAARPAQGRVRVDLGRHPRSPAHPHAHRDIAARRAPRRPGDAQRLGPAGAALEADAGRERLGARRRARPAQRHLHALPLPARHQPALPRVSTVAARTASPRLPRPNNRRSPTSCASKRSCAPWGGPYWAGSRRPSRTATPITRTSRSPTDSSCSSSATSCSPCSRTSSARGRPRRSSISPSSAPSIRRSRSGSARRPAAPRLGTHARPAGPRSSISAPMASAAPAAPTTRWTPWNRSTTHDRRRPGF